MASNRILLYYVSLLLLFLSVSGQGQTFVLTGRITGPDKSPISEANIQVKNSQRGTFSDHSGKFKLQINLQKDSVLIFTAINYESVELQIPPNNLKEISVIMQSSSIKLDEVQINERRKSDPGVVNIDPLLTKNLSNTSGGAIEQLVKTLPGVSSHSELTPQYSVRGGNYDENLLYVNGIEIFRPFLVKTGEQEGLSFLNPDLVKSIRFSSGGFESAYGDKMSSVLDISYKVPDKTAGTAEVGALGASAHFEGRGLGSRFTHLTGIRYRDNRYLLGTLDQKGHYSPACFDFQTLLGFDFSPKFSISFLGNLSSNNYSFSPETRETRFGTLSQTYLLKIYFEGKEKDQFSNRMGAITVNYQPGNNLHLKLSASSFNSDEKERYDILGQYYLNEVFSGSMPSENPDSTLLLGVGSSLKHAGNFLQASIQTIEHNGEYNLNKHQIRWGFKFQSENIRDQVSEWEMRDSSGYSLPYNNPTLALYYSIKADNNLISKRLSGYLQDCFNIEFPNSSLLINYGGRIQYWDFNQQTIFSPRISLRYTPNKLRQLQLHGAWGIYQQMPFYKELKNRNAEIVSDAYAQKSVHYVAGLDYPFTWGDRPFKFSTELWYKSLTHLIPYKVVNLDLQYFPEQQAKGYATGLEMKIFGEPIPGATSWASVTIMKTEEDILSDSYLKPAASGSPATMIYPGYLPRPTDQRFNFSLFFQDYLPKNPTVKMNLTLLYGNGLPFGPPRGERYLDNFRMPSYKRVDLGFSKMLVGNPDSKHVNFFSKSLKEAWLSLEIFNLFDLDNTISYYWVSDFENQMHAVPNYLTGRRINAKLSVSF
ncbi:MAG: TonB-dependent receptor [Prolixibacteraceae bacterium]